MGKAPVGMGPGAPQEKYMIPRKQFGIPKAGKEHLGIDIMAKCKNCGMELGPEETCVFATYRLDMNGKELMICCERCAANMNEPQQVAAPPALLAPPALSVERPSVKAPARRKIAPKSIAKKKAGKAPKKVAKKSFRPSAKKAARKTARKPTKKAARRPKRKAAAQKSRK